LDGGDEGVFARGAAVGAGCGRRLRDRTEQGALLDEPADEWWVEASRACELNGFGNLGREKITGCNFRDLRSWLGTR
jgi:hypothetical protein